MPNSKFSWGRTPGSTALRDWGGHGGMIGRGMVMEERRHRIGVEGRIKKISTLHWGGH